MPDMLRFFRYGRFLRACLPGTGLEYRHRAVGESQERRGNGVRFQRWIMTEHRPLPLRVLSGSEDFAA